jgi:carbon monoxide dehydrogenase subunit G
MDNLEQQYQESTDETTASTSSSGGAITLNLATSRVHLTTLTENITSITISNPGGTGRLTTFTWGITQHASSAKTVAGWPASVKWPWGGTVPAMSTGLSKVDWFTFWSPDNGTTWYGSVAQNY